MLFRPGSYAESQSWCDLFVERPLNTYVWYNRYLEKRKNTKVVCVQKKSMREYEQSSGKQVMDPHQETQPVSTTVGKTNSCCKTRTMMRPAFFLFKNVLFSTFMKYSYIISIIIKISLNKQIEREGRNQIIYSNIWEKIKFKSISLFYIHYNNKNLMVPKFQSPALSFTLNFRKAQSNADLTSLTSLMPLDFILFN